MAWLRRHHPLTAAWLAEADEMPPGAAVQAETPGRQSAAPVAEAEPGPSGGATEGPAGARVTPPFRERPAVDFLSAEGVDELCDALRGGMHARDAALRFALPLGQVARLAQWVRECAR
jgi:hypothetical protein